MSYLNCPSCGLTLAMLRAEAEIEHCPRCLARARRAVGLFVSAEPRGRKPARESATSPAPHLRSNPTSTPVSRASA